MDTPARLLRLLALFSLKPTWRAGDLAARLDVTSRTLRRDLQRLRTLGYPIDATTGRYGGYSMGQGGKLPPLLLDEEEAVAVSVALREMSRDADPTIGESALAALTKLLQIMPTGLSQRVAALGAVTESGAPPREGQGVPLALGTLLTAALGCRRGEQVRFTYRTFEGDQSQRRVEPHRIVSFDRKWYLVGFDLDRQAWRTFRIDRTSDLELTGHRNVERPTPDAGRLVREGVAVNAYGVHAEVLVHAPIDQATSWIPPTTGIAESTDDPNVTRFRIGGDADWIARRLATLPVRVEVVSPIAVRDELRALGRRLVREHAPASRHRTAS